jgi:membrane protein DedA with SNARE-associated domain
VSLSEDVSQTILQLVDQFGLFAVFFALILDSAMILPFVPGELILTIAVKRFATSPAMLTVVVIVATAGTVVGSFLLFLIAKYGGRNFIMNHPRLFMMSSERRDKLEKTFKRPLGQSLVLFFRLFPFLRIIVSLPAGLARMPNLRFLILTTIGSFAFNAGLMWFLYESAQPDSKIAATIDATNHQYIEPGYAWGLENLTIVAAIVVAVGILSSIRRSFRMLGNPTVPLRNTLLGTLAVTALFWGGVLLIVGLWTDPLLVYDGIAKSGIDVVALTEDYVPFGLGPLLATMAVGIASCLVALFLIWFRSQFESAAKRRRARLKSGLQSETNADLPPLMPPPPSNEV